MSDAEALAAALCPMSRLRPGAFDRCAVHGAHIDYATAILAALHESGWTVERAGEVSRLRAWVPRIVWSEAFHEFLRMGEREDHAMARADLVRMGVERAWDERADRLRAALAQPAPDATACRTCGHDKGAHFLAEGPCNFGRCNCIEVRPQPQEDA